MTITVREHNAQVTLHQLSVARLVAEGHTAKEVAQSLGMDVRSVDSVMVCLRHNLKARNSTHVIAKLIRAKLI